MSSPAALPQGRVDIDGTRTVLSQLGLSYIVEALPQMLPDAVKENLPPHRFLDKLLGAEFSRREERRIKTSLKLSGLPPGQTLGNFDFGFQPGIEKGRIETLATCAFIRDHATVLMCGPPGPGKRTSPWRWASRPSRTGSPWRSTGSKIFCTR